jgi:hypothetical protein
MNPGITILIVIVAVFAGIFLAGLYGDVVVGAVIVGVAVLLETAAGLTAQAWRTWKARSEAWRSAAVKPRPMNTMRERWSSSGQRSR